MVHQPRPITADPPNNLDTDNGGFTVFGNVSSARGHDGRGRDRRRLPIYNFGLPFDAARCAITPSDFASA